MTEKPWRARIMEKYREELDRWFAEMAEDEAAMTDWVGEGGSDAREPDCKCCRCCRDDHFYQQEPCDGWCEDMEDCDCE